DGYDIVLTEAHTLSSRGVRMKMKRSPAIARRPDEGRGTAWMFRPQPPDVLRDAGAGPPESTVLLVPPTRPDGSGGDAPGRSPGAGFLGSADGEIAQLVGAGLLPGLEGAGGDAVRDTTVTLRAPLSESIAWSVAGRSLRNEAPAEGDEVISGRSDRLALGMSLDGGAEARVRGRARAGYADDAAGTDRISDRVIEAEGDVRLADTNTRLAVAVQVWSTHSEADAATAGEGAAIYAGSRSRVGDRLDVDYGFEYRADTLTRRPRAVPRIGFGYARPAGDPLTLRADLLLDATSPGARVAITARPRGQVDLAAALTFLPANALDAVAPAAASDPAFFRSRSAAVEPAGARSADRRALELSVARSFGALRGSLSGSVGRTGRRAVPLVEDAALPVLSYGEERFYETRLGVGYLRSSTRMELGYRRVAAAEGDPEGTEGAGLAYSRMDVLVAQGLPSPRLLSGARLSAMLSWQGLDYERLDAGAGVLLCGLATRLTGGVGLSF
ncbi:MAG TPA: hypothetical protein VFD06_06665, partial [Candidatus Polarisedimenticolia bacterium]|nr:hypothetical protein [Candidatus Polarisedimenticolia bacterium]